MSNRPAIVELRYNNHPQPPPPLFLPSPCAIFILFQHLNGAALAVGLTNSRQQEAKLTTTGPHTHTCSQGTRAAGWIRGGQGPGARSHIAHHAVRQHATLETAVTAGPQDWRGSPSPTRKRCQVRARLDSAPTGLDQLPAPRLQLFHAGRIRL